MKIILIYFIYNTALFAWPSNVPEEATFDANTKTYILKENSGKKTIWDHAGRLTIISKRAGGVTEISTYRNGRWISRTRYNNQTPTKLEKLPPEMKPTEIPNKATFNFDFRKWEDGEMIELKKNGIWTLFWPTGDFAGTIEYKDGLYHGKLETFWENGQPYQRARYVNGKMDGEYRTFHENGVFYEFGNYRSGVLVGIGTRYDDKGRLKERIEVKSDNVVTREYFNETYEEKSERLRHDKAIEESRKRRNLQK